MSRIPYDSLTSVDLSASSLSLLSSKSTVSPSRCVKADTPFYAPSPTRRTSASIIREAKANMTRPGAFPAIDDAGARASVRTVDTKRPFTPRQTDRRLYSGSTNHVARPPSSFRLLPLPEEERLGGAKGGCWEQGSGSSSGPGSAGERLPRLLPQVVPSARSRQQFRASSLTDVLEVVEQREEGRQVRSSPTQRPSTALLGEVGQVSLIQKIHSQVAERAKPRREERQRKSVSIDLPEEREEEKEQREERKGPKEEKKEARKPTAEPAKRAEDLILPSLLSELKDPNLDKAVVKQKLVNLYKFIVDCDNPKFFSKKKSDLIKILCQFVDTDSPEILILLVQILLSINVKKQNLATAYKLIFKVAREDENDSCFLTGDTLDLLINSIGRADPVADSEALVYGYGALKFLTMNVQTREKLQKMGILDLVLLHLKLICEAKSERRISDETSHVLFQLTGVIRNMVNEVPSQQQLVAMGGITQICKCLSLFITDLDVVCNIARTLSVMSSDEAACAALTDSPTFASTAVKVLQKYPGRQDIVVRLTYCLGNLMAKCDEARPCLSLGEEETGASHMECLLELLTSYRRKEARPPSTQVSVVMKMEAEDDHGSSGNSEDVVIKIIRVVANMSINSEVGQQVAGMPEVYDNLTDILATRSVEESEELILSTLATLNNLTYYPVDVSGKEAQDINVFTMIQKYIDCSNLEAQIESSRVLGNLTRSPGVRDSLATAACWPGIIRLLASDQRDLIYTSVGVIVNMMSDLDKRQSLRGLGGVTALVRVLRQCGEQVASPDWLLASLTCQALWNYSIDTRNLFDCMDKEELSELEAILVEYLDEDTIFGSQEELDAEQVPRYQEWEEFAKVGVNLLERLESFLEPLEPSDEEEEESEEEEDGQEAYHNGH